MVWRTVSLQCIQNHLVPWVGLWLQQTFFHIKLHSTNLLPFYQRIHLLAFSLLFWTVLLFPETILRDVMIPSHFLKQLYFSLVIEVSLVFLQMFCFQLSSHKDFCNRGLNECTWTFTLISPNPVWLCFFLKASKLFLTLSPFYFTVSEEECLPNT